MYHFKDVVMEELDQLIREAGMERTPDDFTAKVMEQIRPLPQPESVSPVQIPLWFKIFMGSIFAGALLLVFYATTGSSEAAAGGGGLIAQGIGYVTGAFSLLSTWIVQQVWLLPAFLFSLAGILFLLVRDPQYDQRYA